MLKTINSPPPSVHSPSTVAFPTLRSLFGGQMVERFRSGSAVFWEQDEAKYVFEVVEGVFRIFKIIGEGRRVITGFLYPGDLIGVSLRDRYLYSAEAVGDAKVRRFRRRAFQDFIAERPELRSQLFACLCDEMAVAQEQMVLLSRKNADERVCHFLLEIQRRSGSELAPTVALPMTRQDMADYLGLTIETVSRTMIKLMERGVISYNTRHTVSIRRPHILQILAGDGNAHGVDRLSLRDGD